MRRLARGKPELSVVVACWMIAALVAVFATPAQGQTPAATPEPVPTPPGQEAEEGDGVLPLVETIIIVPMDKSLSSPGNYSIKITASSWPLALGSGYYISLSTSGVAGLNSSCSSNSTIINIPNTPSSAFITYRTIWGCQAGSGSVTASLYDNTGESPVVVASYTSPLTVTSPPDTPTPTSPPPPTATDTPVPDPTDTPTPLPPPTPTPSPPDAPGNFSATAAQNSYSISVSWSPVTGAKDYELYWKKDLSESWNFKRTTVRSHNFPGLSSNTKYNFKVRAFGDGTNRKADWGPFASDDATTVSPTPVPPTPTPVPLPTITLARQSASVTEGNDVRFTLTASKTLTANLTVNVSVTTAGAFFTGNVPSQITIASGSASAFLILKTVNDAIDETDGSATASLLSGSGYSRGQPRSGSVTVEDNDTQFSTPTNLTITPLPLRKAKLSWTGDSRANLASYYVVDVRKQGATGWCDPNLSERTAASAVITLDMVYDTTGQCTTQRGMADLTSGQSYEYRMRARFDADTSDNDDLYVDSGYSETVRIIDNPLLVSGGRAYASGSQKAKLHWARISGVSEYTIKYRMLDKSPPQDGSGALYPHSHVRWPANVNWPYYLDDSTQERSSPNPAVPTVSDTISGLSTEQIYAFRISHTASSGEEVFSARDAYVYASGTLPSGRVATFPSFGYWDGGKYDYTVCSDTFPDNAETQKNESTLWVDLIYHAFEQWEEAVQDSITVSGSSGSCTSDHGPLNSRVPLTLIRALYNESNEVYMVDPSQWTEWTTILILTNNRLFLCIDFGSACVISTRYTKHPFGTPPQALDAGSVDVLVNIKRTPGSNGEPKLDIPGSDKIVSDDDTRFNTCLIGTGDTVDGTEDSDFFNYSLMVHEAGHALGLSGYVPFQSWLSPLPSHPTIPDSVMNYNSKVLYPVASGYSEPDCSPNPFDIMAIEALYQAIP